MLIDCDTCAAPASACAGCVMTVLLRGRAGSRPDRGVAWGGIELDAAEHAAITTLARAGLVPPLQLVRGMPAGAPVDDEPGRLAPHVSVEPDSSRGIA